MLSHGGGTLPYALGRLVRGHENLKGKAADPRAGWAAMYFDSCVFDTDALRYLARKAGPDRIMLGSDAPFPMGDPAPRKVIEAAAFTAEDTDAHPQPDRAAGVPRATGLLVQKLMSVRSRAHVSAVCARPLG